MKFKNTWLAAFIAVISGLSVSWAGTVNVSFDGKFASDGGFFSANHQDVSLETNSPERIVHKGYISGNDSSVSSVVPVEWIQIPGGKFLMGTDDLDPVFLDAKPVHEVSVMPFEMTKSLVTIDQYGECVNKGKCRKPSGYAFSCNWGMPNRGNYPVNCVTWEQANQYAAFMGARLPTEAEWEYAATNGGKNHKYPWGNAEPTEKNVACGVYRGGPEPVCEKPLGNTEHGLCDMTGNLMQILQDRYSSSYIGAPVDGSSNQGGFDWVLRGAEISECKYLGDSKYYRSDLRHHFQQYGDARESWSVSVGFRIARKFKQSPPVEWVDIDGGVFEMGTDGFLPGFEDTKPQHSVSVKAFKISKTDVTVSQYMECVSKGKCVEPNTGDSCNWGKANRQDHPINCVDWNQANQYAKFIGARLPTEAEWEYAARSGGKDYSYPWGEALPAKELIVMNTTGTMPVCSRPAGNTEQGLCDMGGNVFQWVQDKYVNSYEGAPVDGSPVEAGGPLRGLRGSSFNNANESLMRSVYRFATAPGYRYDFIGFRVARSR